MIGVVSRRFSQGGATANAWRRLLFVGPVAGVVVLTAADPNSIPGPLNASVLDVVDGDTIVVSARIWLGQTVETRVRIAGVDAPEIQGRCPEEIDLAVRARDLVAAKLVGGKAVLRQVRFGKYAGRVVARVTAPDGADLTNALIAAGLGRTSADGRRLPWCGANAGR